MGDRRPPKTVEEMASILTRSELVRDLDLASMLDAFRRNYLPSSNEPDDVSALRAYLVAAGILTKWQCDKLQNGQWKGFFLDGHELLEAAGKEMGRMIYLARRSRAGPIIRLAVAPATRAKE